MSQSRVKAVAAPSKYDVPDRMTYLIEGLVRPKQRPRLGKGGQFYTPEETHDSENRIRLAVLQILGQRRPRTDGRYAVTLEFVGQHGDLDNLAKTVLDACNRLLWDDDRQVDSLSVSKAMGPSSFVCMTVVRSN